MYQDILSFGFCILEDEKKEEEEKKKKNEKDEKKEKKTEKGEKKDGEDKECKENEDEKEEQRKDGDGEEHDHDEVEMKKKLEAISRKLNFGQDVNFDKWDNDVNRDDRIRKRKLDDFDSSLSTTLAKRAKQKNVKRDCAQEKKTIPEQRKAKPQQKIKNKK
ncbi:hypothetical protein CDL12_23635 [Handroanthus impetiginosus]|uniref:Uncharacterized protein n=1 Tax=Handroanthus impetiginosus TaxID=429701 RepID=A0A2G9GEX1_9LAMI|nr:hypothetical protein CDL12_23635 [Handroanthus impetiginosus]